MGDVDWISLVQNMDSWLAVVNAVMDLRIPYVWEFLDNLSNC